VKRDQFFAKRDSFLRKGTHVFEKRCKFAGTGVYVYIYIYMYKLYRYIYMYKIYIYI